MARPRPADFLTRLVGAASLVFTEKGLKRARMSDVAKEMTVAHGTLYNYVESKDALFHLLIKHGTAGARPELPSDLPIRAPSRETLQRQLERRIESTFSSPKLDAALRRQRVADARGVLAEIVQELYRQSERTRWGTLVIERSTPDLPPALRARYVAKRDELLERLTTYLERRVHRGHFQAADPAVAARLLLECIAYFARHRHLERERLAVTEEAVTAHVVEMLVRTLTVR